MPRGKQNWLRSSIRARTYINFSYRFLARYFGNRPFRLLDIGSGNQSATKITREFPNCEYYGLDKTRAYNYSEDDFVKMKDFYEIDLSTFDYKVIPDNHFDVLWMVHVIEHLDDGDRVISALLSKLNPGGYFYIEYPGPRSTQLPSMYGTLNFYDDPTHVRLYSVKELKSVFEKNGCMVLKSGTRRNWIYILATPARVLHKIFTGKRVEGNLFWDVLGFAEYLWVVKRETANDARRQT